MPPTRRSRECDIVRKRGSHFSLVVDELLYPDWITLVEINALTLTSWALRHQLDKRKEIVNARTRALNVRVPMRLLTLQRTRGREPDDSSPRSVNTFVLFAIRESCVVCGATEITLNDEPRSPMAEGPHRLLGPAYAQVTEARVRIGRSNCIVTTHVCFSKACAARVGVDQRYDTVRRQWCGRDEMLLSRKLFLNRKEAMANWQRFRLLK